MPLSCKLFLDSNCFVLVEIVLDLTKNTFSLLNFVFQTDIQNVLDRSQKFGSLQNRSEPIEGQGIRLQKIDGSV